MPSVPDMWRIEVLHPSVVHFPIALLITGGLIWLVGSFVDAEGRWGFLKPAGRLAIVAGAVGAWIAVYTGDLANAEVARSLCDPTVKKDHENLAYITAAVFTGAIAVDLALLFIDVRDRIRTALTVLVGLALVAGMVLMGVVGHLGGRLVYEQAAGVYRPTEMCTEFM